MKTRTGKISKKSKSKPKKRSNVNTSFLNFLNNIQMTTPNRAKKAISNAKQTLSTSPLKKSNRYSIPNNNNFMVQIKNIKTPPKGAKPKNNIEYILNTTNHHKMASNFFNILPKNKKSNNIREMNNLYTKLTNNVRNITPIKSKLRSAVTTPQNMPIKPLPKSPTNHKKNNIMLSAKKKK